MIGCKLCAIINAVGQEDSTAILGALGDPNFTNVQLAEVLTNNGHNISEASIRRHLRHRGKK